MPSPNEPSMLARNLSHGKFLRLVLLGSVGDPASGRKLVIDPDVRRPMAIVGGLLPTLFLVLILTATITPTWPNVVVFLVVIVGAYIITMRAAKLVESES